MTDEETHARFMEHLAAAAATVDLLESHGMPVGKMTKTDMHAVAALAAGYARDPMSTAKKTVHLQKIAAAPPPALREAHRILSTFGHSVVQDSIQIRHMVTNKLIKESENPDPRVRLKALELLGKISDVGLFAEKIEKTVTHQTADDLKLRLKEKLSRLLSEGDIMDAEIVPDTPTNPHASLYPPQGEQPDYNEVETYIDISDLPVDFDDEEEKGPR